MRRHLRITTKVALWSALLAAAVLLIFVIVLNVAHDRMEVIRMDAQLRAEAAHFLALYEQHERNPAWVSQRGFEEVMSVANDPHVFTEVAGKDGRILARSRSLGQGTLGNLPQRTDWATLDGQKVRALAVERGGMTFRIASDLRQELAEEQMLERMLFIALPLALLAVGLGAWFVARQALRPVREMADAARQITPERLAERLPESAVRDEIGQLSRAFNATLDRLETRFSQAARFSADASHELKTPLAVARAGLSELLHEPGLAAHHQERVAEVLEHVGRLADITESLLLLSRADAGRLALAAGRADASPTVRELVADFSPLAEERNVTLAAEICAAAPAHAEPWALRMVVMNLLDNAIKYTAGGGHIGVALAAAEETVTLRVGNSGPGIAPEDAPHLFDRFFRSTHTAEIPGSGLGLSLARELARAMGGDLALTTATPGWTEFTLTLRAVKPIG